MASDFNTRSLLYWLCGVLALVITVIGLVALFAPTKGADIFGLHAIAAEGKAWVRLFAARELTLGLILFALMVLKQGRIAGILLLLALVIPITDAATVYSQAGWNRHILMHAVSIPYMVVVGIALLRHK
jgi:Flp pilus assembly protein protease CpaA